MSCPGPGPGCECFALKGSAAQGGGSGGDEEEEEEEDDDDEDADDDDKVEFCFMLDNFNRCSFKDAIFITCLYTPSKLASSSGYGLNELTLS